MTETATMNTYEGMFLFPQIASSDLKAAQEHVEYLIGRGEGEIISLAKWDERRLAYEIKGNRRGLYFLTYFKRPFSHIDCTLRTKISNSNIEHLNRSFSIVICDMENYL